MNKTQLHQLRLDRLREAQRNQKWAVETLVADGASEAVLKPYRDALATTVRDLAKIEEGDRR